MRDREKKNKANRDWYWRNRDTEVTRRSLNRKPEDPKAKKVRNHKYYEQHKTELNENNAIRLKNKKKRVYLERAIASVAIIVHDPDTTGAAFSAGSQINCINECLQHSAFTPNTILENAGKRYRVDEHLGVQRLVLIET